MPRTVVVTAATGKVGFGVVRELVQSGEPLNIVPIVRDAAKMRAMLEEAGVVRQVQEGTHLSVLQADYCNREAVAAQRVEQKLGE